MSPCDKWRELGHVRTNLGAETLIELAIARAFLPMLQWGLSTEARVAFFLMCVFLKHAQWAPRVLLHVERCPSLKKIFRVPEIFLSPGRARVHRPRGCTPTHPLLPKDDAVGVPLGL